MAFNKAVLSGELKGPVVISRDHHDVSGADSPYRETANIRDGSKFCAGMSWCLSLTVRYGGSELHWRCFPRCYMDILCLHICLLLHVALHNGGGTGWGEAINGGFGMVLDGTEATARRASQMLKWDVVNGVSYTS